MAGFSALVERTGAWLTIAVDYSLQDMDGNAGVIAQQICDEKRFPRLVCLGQVRYNLTASMSNIRARTHLARNNTNNTLAGSIASQADSAADRCADDPNWHSTMGETFTCSTYAADVRGSNFLFCGTDSDGANVLATVACPGELSSAIRHESRNFLACVLKCQKD